jgi:cell division protein FtsB
MASKLPESVQRVLAELKRRREEIDAQIRRLEGDKAREPKVETRGMLRGVYGEGA